YNVPGNLTNISEVAFPGVENDCAGAISFRFRRDLVFRHTKNRKRERAVNKPTEDASCWDAAVMDSGFYPLLRAGIQHFSGRQEFVALCGSLQSETGGGKYEGSLQHHTKIQSVLQCGTTKTDNSVFHPV